MAAGAEFGSFGIIMNLSARFLGVALLRAACIVLILTLTASTLIGAERGEWFTDADWNTLTNSLLSQNSSTQMEGLMKTLFLPPARAKEHAARLCPLILGIAESGTNTNATILAIACLGKFEAESTNALPVLERIALNEKRPEELRTLAFHSLVDIGGRESGIVLHTLEQLLDDWTHASVRYRAYTALSAYDEPPFPNCISTLLKALTDDRNGERWRVIRALGAVGRNSPEVLVALRKQLDSNVAADRAEAIMALARRSKLPGSVVARIGELLLDKDGDVRTNAVMGLESIGTNAFSARPSLNQASISAPDKFVRKGAKQILDRFEHFQPTKTKSKQ